MPKIALSYNLLIIGAGAHVPYKFPTSQQLTNRIKEIYADPTKVVFIKDLQSERFKNNPNAKIKHELCEIALNIGFVPTIGRGGENDIDLQIAESLDDFLRSFCESQVYSIDTYLSQISSTNEESNYRVKSYWGRLLVAYLISSFETQIPFGTHNFDWIQLIIDKHLKNNLEEFFKNPPKIITFNYDRFFERCIYKHLIEFHKIAPHRAKEMVDSLPIIHVEIYKCPIRQCFRCK